VISVFLPTIVRVLGYSGAKANLMTVPIYVTAYICLIISAWISDFTQNRSLPIFAGGCISGVGYLLLGLLHDHYTRYASTFLIVVVSLTMTGVEPPLSSDHHC
jgi:cyanate permease